MKVYKSSLGDRFELHYAEMRAMDDKTLSKFVTAQIAAEKERKKLEAKEFERSKGLKITPEQFFSSDLVNRPTAP